MRIIRSAPAAVLLALVPAVAGWAGAQTPRAGTVEHIKVHGKALEGNLEGDSPDRDVTVYLPPSYTTDRAKRYPVVYLLHGYTGTDSTFNGRLATLAETADKLAAAGAIGEMIVVMPNAFSLHKGSMYSNSVTSGDWETYVARDLVAYTDSHYRTIADRMSRGLGGHSMGGYGTVRIGMKRPDVFSSLYIMSACCLEPQLNPRPEQIAAAAALKTREAAEEASHSPGFGPSVTLASAAAWSPNPSNPPLYLDLPIQDGNVRRDVVAKWAANAPLAMIDQYIPSLKSYHAIGIEIGTKDNLLPANQKLDQAMSRFGIAHLYEEYDGDHTNRVASRVETSVLPFFSKNLSFGPKAATGSTRH
jgi:S-formylglutathione hydrolase FrmB